MEGVPDGEVEGVPDWEVEGVPDREVILWCCPALRE